MYIALDIGGTNTRIVASATLEDVMFAKEISIETNHDYYIGEQDIVEAIKDFGIEVNGIGIGLPGSINSQGVLDGSTNLPDWVAKPLNKVLEQDFHCSVFVKNDAETGALGEAYYGAGKESNFLYLTWGTGVGVAQIHHHGTEVSVSRPADRQSVYDLEKLIGGKNIECRFGVPASELDESQWVMVVKDLVETLPALATEYGFSKVVLGGGIAVHRKDQLENVFSQPYDVTVSVTDLEGQAGLYGAFGMCKCI